MRPRELLGKIDKAVDAHTFCRDVSWLVSADTCWKPYAWSGDSRGAWGQITSQRKIIFAAGMCVSEGSAERGQEVP